MKLMRILVPAIVLPLLLISACSLESGSGSGLGGELTSSSWSYNYFYKDALYNFVFNFEDANNLKLTITDDSIPPESGQVRETTISGNYYVDGGVLTIELKSVKDDLHLVNTDTENSKVDMLYSISSGNSLELIRAHNLFPILPNEVVLNRMNS